MTGILTGRMSSWQAVIVQHGLRWIVNVGDWAMPGANRRQTGHPCTGERAAGHEAWSSLAEVAGSDATRTFMRTVPDSGATAAGIFCHRPSGLSRAVRPNLADRYPGPVRRQRRRAVGPVISRLASIPQPPRSPGSGGWPAGSTAGTPRRPQSLSPVRCSAARAGQMLGDYAGLQMASHERASRRRRG